MSPSLPQVLETFAHEAPNALTQAFGALSATNLLERGGAPAEGRLVISHRHSRYLHVFSTQTGTGAARSPKSLVGGMSAGLKKGGLSGLKAMKHKAEASAEVRQTLLRIL